jgi:hypothetical protein
MVTEDVSITRTPKYTQADEYSVEYIVKMSKENLVFSIK